jgi:hypothetical protein
LHTCMRCRAVPAWRCSPSSDPRFLRHLLCCSRLRLRPASPAAPSPMSHLASSQPPARLHPRPPPSSQASPRRPRRPPLQQEAAAAAAARRARQAAAAAALSPARACSRCPGWRTRWWTRWWPSRWTCRRAQPAGATSSARCR